MNYYDFGTNLKLISQSENFKDYKLRPILYLFKFFNNQENIFILPISLLFLNVLGILLPMMFFIRNTNNDFIFFIYPLIFLVGVLVHNGFHSDVFYIYFGVLNLLYFHKKNKKFFYITLIIILLIKSTLLILHLFFLTAYIFRKKILDYKKILFSIILLLFFGLLIRSLNNPDLILYFLSHHLLLFIPLYLFIYKINPKEFLITYLFITLLIAHFLNYQILNINNHFNVFSFAITIFYILRSNENIFKNQNVKIKLVTSLHLILTTFFISNNIFNIQNGNYKKFYYNSQSVKNHLKIIKDLNYNAKYFIVYQNNAFFYLNSNKNNFEFTPLRSDLEQTIKNKKNVLLFLNKKKLFIGDQICDEKKNKCFVSKNKTFEVEPSTILKYINNNFKVINENSKIKILEKNKK